MDRQCVHIVREQNTYYKFIVHIYNIDSWQFDVCAAAAVVVIVAAHTHATSYKVRHPDGAGLACQRGHGPYACAAAHRAVG